MKSEDMKEGIRGALLAAGAVAAGFARSADISDHAYESYVRWINRGMHADMDYLRRHSVLRRNPRNVLPDAATVISLAFPYAPGRWRADDLPQIACYAYGIDYHEVIRNRLSPIVESLKPEYGGNWRICVDTAPVAERYWAVKSGIGIRGLNGSVIVPGHGSFVFLAEVLTSLPLEPDDASVGTCGACGKCREACPQGAICSDGMIDASRCINYLTIEHRGAWTGEKLGSMSTEAARRSLYGCDICQKVCSHNRGIPPTEIAEFQPCEGILTLTAEMVSDMDAAAFSSFFSHSAIKRAKLDGLHRNALNTLHGLRQ